ncbi:MAG: Crp/Fnr family transcriptional regulator [Myxococcota bacterium]
MEKLDILHRTRLFEMLSNPELEMLGALCQAKRYEPGEIIFEEGEVGNALYLLVDGPVEVFRKRGDMEKVLAVLKPPDFFGEMSIIDKEYRSASVRAIEPCTLLALTIDNLLTFRTTYRDGFCFIVINIARVLSRRLRNANARLVERI